MDTCKPLIWTCMWVLIAMRIDVLFETSVYCAVVVLEDCGNFSWTIGSNVCKNQSANLWVRRCYIVGESATANIILIHSSWFEMARIGQEVWIRYGLRMHCSVRKACKTSKSTFAKTHGTASTANMAGQKGRFREDVTPRGRKTSSKGNVNGWARLWMGSCWQVGGVATPSEAGHGVPTFFWVD